MSVAYDEFVDFLARGTTTQGLIDFRPSEAARSTIAELIHRQKTSGLSAEDTAELNLYLQLEHIIRLAKARARQRLLGSSSAMSVTYVKADLRRLVQIRADGLCEYCLIADEDTGLGCEVDHVIGEKHGGPTNEQNLAMACVFCNQAKGSDIGSIFWGSGAFVRFFNPRVDRWTEHFFLKDYRIEPRTEIGAVTARILQFNTVERLLERQALALANRYPGEAARRRMDR